jgi:4-hydroxybenzoate polyprenyltransferase
MNFLSLIRLVRPLNLLIVASTMFAVRYWVIDTLVSPLGFELQLSTFNFILLVISVISVAAAGNAINDYFDSRIDTINKPDEVIIGYGVTRRVAMAAHFILSICGILLGAYLSWKVGRINLVAIHIFSAATLWYYSSVFKKQMLLGNFVVALLAGLVPLVVGLFEIPLLSTRYAAEVVARFEGTAFDPNMYFRIIFNWVLGFAAFAFLLNLLREVQKDFADVKGDRENGRETLPIVMGTTFTKWVVTALILLICALLVYVYYEYINHLFSLAYFAVLLVIPLIASLVVTWAASERKTYLLAGNIVKFVMLAGILYSYFIEKLLAD